jgi:phospholipid/cholesterol/gamma-HCH transport system permease protein
MSGINWVFTRLEHIGSAILTQLSDFGRACLFILKVLRASWSLLLYPRELIRQIYLVGVQSLSIIMVSGVFVGMVLTLQLYYELTRFGAESTLGLLNSLSLLRELGPVISALLFAGRACSALTAEIGLMKATEQLSGMEMMAIDPIRRVMVPRFWGGAISVPALAIIFSTVGIGGGYLVGVELFGLDGGTYWSQMQASVSFSSDVLNGIIKSVAFGVVITWIALFQGYDAIPTPEGVSQATTRTVVLSSLTVLALDFVLTAVMYG